MKIRREARAIRTRVSEGGRSRLVVCAAVLGATFLALVRRYGIGFEAVELAIFSAALLRLSLSDLDERRIPNACIVVALVARLAYLTSQWAVGAMEVRQLFSYVLSALFIGAMLLAFIVLCDRMTGEASMGGGDLKLFVVAALYFGFLQTIFLVLLACVLGIVSSFLFQGAADDKNDQPDGSVHSAGKGMFPFGPAISLACLIMMLWGDAMAAAYYSLL